MKAPKELLEQLHGAVASGLLDKIMSGEAGASDYAQAIKFLKDNGIEAIATDDNPLGHLKGTLASRVPFTSDDEHHH